MSDPHDARRPAPLAVALRHDRASGDAPRVTASGRGALAEQILSLAFAHGVKVREDADLAGLLATLEIDSPVPPAVFATIAEILTYVYRANGRAAEFGDWGAAIAGEAP